MTEDDAIRGVVMRRLLLLYDKQSITQNGIIFLGTDPRGKGKPSKALLQSLSGSSYMILPASEAIIRPNGVFGKNSGHRGCIMYFMTMKATQKGDREVMGNLYRGGREGSSWIVRVRRANGKWFASEAKITGIY